MRWQAFVLTLVTLSVAAPDTLAQRRKKEEPVNPFVAHRTMGYREPATDQEKAKVENLMRRIEIAKDQYTRKRRMAPRSQRRHMKFELPFVGLEQDSIGRCPPLIIEQIVSDYAMEVLPADDEQKKKVIKEKARITIYGFDTTPFHKGMTIYPEGLVHCTNIAVGHEEIESWKKEIIERSSSETKNTSRSVDGGPAQEIADVSNSSGNETVTRRTIKKGKQIAHYTLEPYPFRLEVEDD